MTPAVRDLVLQSGLNINGVIARVTPSIDVNYITNISTTEGVVSTAVLSTTITRATVGWADSANGLWQSFNSGVARITDLGLLIEEARTNVVLQARDLSNVAWVKLNTTAAKDQVGVDGVSNSASSITATADAGTILQTIVLASTARFQSAFVKRITGTGTLEMTMDTGSTWTAVTVTSAWTRVSIPTQTLANPVVGFRMGTSGDVIAIDFVQNENGTFMTSPIAATTVALARNVDLCKIITPTWLNSSAGSVYLNGTMAQFTNNSTTPIFLSDGTINNRVYFIMLTGPVFRLGNTAAGVANSPVNVSVSDLTTPFKVSFGYEANNYAAYGNNATGTPILTGDVPTGMNDVRFYSTASPVGSVYRIRRFVYWNSKLNNRFLQGVTN